MIDFYGIRILIPSTEITIDAKNDKKLLQNMMGAEIKFIILDKLKSSRHENKGNGKIARN